jgi:hypothetical protein
MGGDWIATGEGYYAGDGDRKEGRKEDRGEGSGLPGRAARRGCASLPFYAFLYHDAPHTIVECHNLEVTHAGERRDGVW